MLKQEEINLIERYRDIRCMNEGEWVKLAGELNQQLGLGILDIEKRALLIWNSVKNTFENDFNYEKLKKMVSILTSTKNYEFGRMLKVDILETKNLKLTNHFHRTSHVFAIIGLIGDNSYIKKKTEGVKDFVNPRFLENSFYFPIEEDSEIISVALYHKHKRKTLIGEVNIPINSILNQKISEWFTLRSNLIVCGEIHLSIDSNCFENMDDIRLNQIKRDFKMLSLDLEKKNSGMFYVDVNYNTETNRLEKYLEIQKICIKLEREAVFNLRLSILNPNGNELSRLEVEGYKEKSNDHTFTIDKVFTIYPNSSSVLEITVWEKNNVFSDQLIGKNEIDISTLLVNQKTTISDDLIQPLSASDINSSFIQTLIEEGKKPMYPVMIIPGFASSSLEVVESKYCPNWEGQRVWLSISKLGNEALTVEKVKNKMINAYNVGAKKVNHVGNLLVSKMKKNKAANPENPKDNIIIKEAKVLPRKKNLWVNHVKLDKEDGHSDPKGIVVRPLKDLNGVEFLDPGVFTSSASYVMGPLIKNLRKFGYTDKNLTAAPYDWRLAHCLVDKRDNYFADLKTKIEMLYSYNENTPVVVLCHSMGNRTFMYFLQWIKFNHPINGQQWIDTHIHTFLAVGAPFLGSSKAIKATTVGDRLGLETLLDEREGIKFGSTLSSGPGLLPISHSYHFESDAEEKMKHFCYIKVSKNNSEDILSSFQPISLQEISNMCDSSKMMRWFNEYFLKDPIYGGNTQDNKDLENLRIAMAPPIKRLVHIYGINLNTQVKYLYSSHKDGKDEKVVLSKVCGKLKNGYVVKKGIVYETKNTSQASINRNFGCSGKRSGDGTVSYASLNYSSNWKGQIEYLSNIEIEGVEHREILNSRVFFKNVIEILSGSYNYPIEPTNKTIPSMGTEVLTEKIVSQNSMNSSRLTSYLPKNEPYLNNTNNNNVNLNNYNNNYTYNSHNNVNFNNNNNNTPYNNTPYNNTPYNNNYSNVNNTNSHQTVPLHINDPYKKNDKNNCTNDGSNNVCVLNSPTNNDQITYNPFNNNNVIQTPENISNAQNHLTTPNSTQPTIPPNIPPSIPPNNNKNVNQNVNTHNIPQHNHINNTSGGNVNHSQSYHSIPYQPYYLPNQGNTTIPPNNNNYAQTTQINPPNTNIQNNNTTINNTTIPPNNTQTVQISSPQNDNNRPPVPPYLPNQRYTQQSKNLPKRSPNNNLINSPSNQRIIDTNNMNPQINSPQNNTNTSEGKPPYLPVDDQKYSHPPPRPPRNYQSNHNQNFNGQQNNYSSPKLSQNRKNPTNNSPNHSFRGNVPQRNYQPNRY